MWFAECSLSIIWKSVSLYVQEKEKDKDDSAIEAEFPDITADDAEAEYINSVCETEVVSKDTLLGKLSPILVDVCRDPKKYPNAKLRSTACLALTKMMLVSSVFCEENLQVSFHFSNSLL